VRWPRGTEGVWSTAGGSDAGQRGRGGTVHISRPSVSDPLRVEVASSAEVEQVVADADGVDDVDCEERNPAEHEHACQRTTHTYTRPTANSSGIQQLAYTT